MTYHPSFPLKFLPHFPFHYYAKRGPFLPPSVSGSSSTLFYIIFLYYSSFPFSSISFLLRISNSSISTPRSIHSFCFGCGALSIRLPSSSQIPFTVTAILSPSGFITSISSPTENLFLCSVAYRPCSSCFPTIPRYVYSFTYVLLS